APVGLTTIAEQVAAATACMAALQPQLGFGVEMGDEGGFAPRLADNAAALDVLVRAIVAAGYTTEQIRIALDIAATSLYREGAYELGGKRHTDAEMLAWYEKIVASYPIISIEDPFYEEDWDGFAALTAALGETVRVVGDDLTVTNTKRIQEAAKRRAANACIIKPNQIGTVTEAIEAVLTARQAGWKVYASHRSGETMDTFIADFAAGLGCDYLKAGAPTKEERLVKYNRLMDIEKELSSL
ncbi:MAG TPA: phosphopyruvate hydratase, partial [Candidatus Paceibacterota bacterium]|nr:phosphopyruvate hydratase [Candidatus Paceibacterota bacterium]